LKLINDKCPEYIIEMIKFKLDNKNNRKEEIIKSWSDELSKNNLFQSSYQRSYNLTNKLNEIISKLNDKNEVIKYSSCLLMTNVDYYSANMLNKVISNLNKIEPIKEYYGYSDREYKLFNSLKFSNLIYLEI
jgi:hypothetical protein